MVLVVTIILSNFQYFRFLQFNDHRMSSSGLVLVSNFIEINFGSCSFENYNQRFKLLFDADLSYPGCTLVFFVNFWKFFSISKYDFAEVAWMLNSLSKIFWYFRKLEELVNKWVWVNLVANFPRDLFENVKSTFG